MFDLGSLPALFPGTRFGEMKNLKQGLYFVTSCTDMACCQSFPVTRDQ